MRCAPCKLAHKAAGERRRRNSPRGTEPALAVSPPETRDEPVYPEPSKVPEERPPRISAPANQWARRGKIPLDLTGCPEDLPAARIWLMETVFKVQLYRWQKQVIERIGGFPRPERSYIQIGRKNGKSLLAAALILTELVLVPESAVYAVSDSERNLNSVLVRELRTLIGRTYEADAAFVVTKAGIEYPHNGSFFEVRPNNFRATQGINPTLVVMDEVHLQKSDEIWNGMQMAGAASPNFALVGITTPGYDLASFAHEMYLQAKAGSPTLYHRIFEPTRLDCSPDDRTAWTQANPRLIDDPAFLTRLEFDRQTMPEHEFRRFRLGIWTATESAWFPYGAWDACATGRRITPDDIGPNDRVYLGFDGSFSGDSTALVVAVGTHVSVAASWENPGRKTWRVPRDEVEAEITRWMNTSRNVVLLADPPYWTRELGEWALRWPRRVIEFPTHVRARMAPACTTFHAAVLDRRLTHDGDKRLARHVSNAVVKPSPQGDYITKPDPSSPAKIDLAVAAVVAFSASSAAVRERGPAIASRSA